MMVVHPALSHRRPLGPRISMGLEPEASVESRFAFAVDIRPSRATIRVVLLDPGRRMVRGDGAADSAVFANHGRSPVTHTLSRSIPCLFPGRSGECASLGAARRR